MAEKEGVSLNHFLVSTLSRAYVEDMPTLQDPISVMKQFFLFEMVFQDSGFGGELPKESLDAFESKLRDPSRLQDWAFYWLYERAGRTEDLSICRNEFLSAIKSCWSMGNALTFNLMSDMAEISVSDDIE